jgi:hypothetical protein
MLKVCFKCTSSMIQAFYFMLKVLIIYDSIILQVCFKYTLNINLASNLLDAGFKEALARLQVGFN